MKPSRRSERRHRPGNGLTGSRTGFGDGSGKKNLLFALGFVFFLHGCTYAISSDVVQLAAPIAFAQLEADPELYKGKLVILGGTIESIKRTVKGTVVEVTQRPLDLWGKPLRTKSGGRFVVVHTGYPEVPASATGRDITVAAVVEGTRHEGLDDLDFRCPVLLSRELKLWPRERPSWNRPQYFDPLYDPYTSPRQY